MAHFDCVIYVPCFYFDLVPIFHYCISIVNIRPCCIWWWHFFMHLSKRSTAESVQSPLFTLSSWATTRANQCPEVLKLFRMRRQEWWHLTAEGMQTCEVFEGTCLWYLSCDCVLSQNTDSSFLQVTGPIRRSTLVKTGNLQTVTPYFKPKILQCVAWLL